MEALYQFGPAAGRPLARRRNRSATCCHHSVGHKTAGWSRGRRLGEPANRRAWRHLYGTQAVESGRTDVGSAPPPGPILASGCHPQVWSRTKSWERWGRRKPGSWYRPCRDPKAGPPSSPALRQSKMRVSFDDQGTIRLVGRRVATRQVGVSSVRFAAPVLMTREHRSAGRRHQVSARWAGRPGPRGDESKATWRWCST